MKFDLEHDWQGNMSTPRKNLGEKTKLHFKLTVMRVTQSWNKESMTIKWNLCVKRCTLTI